MRLAFMGTPAFAVPALDALVEAGHEVASVYSQPPRPTGRGHRVQPSPVQARAEALGLPVATPVSLKDPEEQERFAALGLDAAVVAAYGLILPQPVLAAPRLGCLNIHASLLPRWRGAAPIQRAILAGDAETGVTIMQMERGLDTGPMLLRQAVPICPATTAPGLTDTLARLGAGLVLEALSGLAAGTLRATPQPAEGVTYAAKLERGEGQIDWRDDAARNERKVRALNPAPGTWFDFEGERIKVLSAGVEPLGEPAAPGTVVDTDLGIASGDGLFRPALLQRAGRAPVERRAFLNGLRIAPGTVLPCPATS
jgi:methionyl-tRNA formyltransferase